MELDMNNNKQQGAVLVISLMLLVYLMHLLAGALERRYTVTLWTLAVVFGLT